MENANYKILVVDDENDILEFLGYNLRKEGFTVYTANNGKKAIKLTMEVNPHLILLDVMMPEMDGIETCEKIRELPGFADVLIAFLTARAEDYSQIAGFEAGGDDYITKPVRPRVLISRIKALLRRYGTSLGLIKKYGPIVIDQEKYIVLKDGMEINLPKKEFSLLLLLTSKPSRVFTRDEIFDTIWGSDVFVGDRTIDVYIRKLREKIGMDVIKTIKGVGYKFEIPVQ
ncbi:MAG: response regulator transcription factor [Bacteroidota bacterium]